MGERGLRDECRERRDETHPADDVLVIGEVGFTSSTPVDALGVQVFVVDETHGASSAYRSLFGSVCCLSAAAIKGFEGWLEVLVVPRCVRR